MLPVQVALVARGKEGPAGGLHHVQLRQGSEWRGGLQQKERWRGGG